MSVSSTSRDLALLQIAPAQTIEDQLVKIQQNPTLVPQRSLIYHAFMWFNFAGNPQSNIQLSDAVRQQVIEAAHSEIDAHGDIQLRNFSVENLSISDMVMLYRIFESYQKDQTAMGRKVVLPHLSLIENKLRQLAQDPALKQVILDAFNATEDGNTKALQFRILSRSNTEMPQAEVGTIDATLRKLPEDYLIVMFEYLSPPEQGVAKQVCKYWNLVLNNDFFARACIKRLSQHGPVFFTSTRISRLLSTPEISTRVKIAATYGEFTKALKAQRILTPAEAPLILSTSTIQEKDQILQDTVLINFFGTLPNLNLLFDNNGFQLGQQMLNNYLANPNAHNTHELAVFFRNTLASSDIVRNLQDLDLSNRGLTALPPEIRFFTSLRNLDLSGNRLTALPKGIEGLVALQVLNLADNQLTSIPEGIEKLVALERLHLSGNRLTSFPKSIEKLVNLLHLDLENNQLTSLPEGIEKLVALQVLNLSGNRINFLPEGIEKLVNLMHLNLENNQLTALPEGFEKLVALRLLNLSGNRLTFLPEGIEKLVNLMHLNLENNQLTALPEGFEKLVALTSLRLSHNKLSLLPSFENFVNLTILQLNNNQLSSLPKGFKNLVRLTHLNLGFNQFLSSPSTPNNLLILLRLVLQDNEISTLYEGFSKLSNLMSYIRLEQVALSSHRPLPNFTSLLNESPKYFGYDGFPNNPYLSTMNYFEMYITMNIQQLTV